MHVQFVVQGGKSHSSRWMGYGVAGLRSAGISASSCTFAELENGIGVDSSIFVVEHDIMRAKRLLGNARIFGWLDDAVWALPINVPQRTEWDMAWPIFERTMITIEGIITPSAMIAAYLRASGAKTFHVPNFHDFPDIRLSESRKESVIGWGGSHYHLVSWREVKHELKALSHSINWGIIEIVGHPQVAWMLQDEGYDVKYIPPMEHNDYLRWLSSIGMCLIPLSGTYDLFRSWIKPIEALWCGTPWIGIGGAISYVYNEVGWREREMRTFSIQQRQQMREYAESFRVTNPKNSIEWVKALGFSN